MKYTVKRRVGGAKRKAPNTARDGNSRTAKKPRNSAANMFNSLNSIPNSKPITPIEYAGVTFYYITLDDFKSFSDKSGLRAVILDNDETTGFYGEIIDYVKNYVREERDLEFAEVIEELKNKLIETMSLRPGYDIFLNKLMNLKESGKLDAVIMYTNMGKKMSINIKGKRYNRPQLLAAVFDRIINKDGKQIFDLLIFRDKPFPKPEKYIAVINKIYGVEGKDNEYLFLDDKPDVIYNNNTKTKSRFAYRVDAYNHNHKGIAFTNKNDYGKSVIEKLDDIFLTSKKNENSAAKANANAKAEEA